LRCWTVSFFSCPFASKARADAGLEIQNHPGNSWEFLGIGPHIFNFSLIYV